MEHHHHGHHGHKPSDAGAVHHHPKQEAVVHHTGSKPDEGPHTHHHEHSMHDKHAGHHTANFLKRFWICLALTAPILFLSHMIQQWLGVNWQFTGDLYILLVLSSIIYFYGGWPFLDGMVRELKAKAPGMMTLVAVAITVAYLYSVAVVFGLPGMDFFWELSTLIDIMLLGHWLEMKSQTAASKSTGIFSRFNAIGCSR